MANRQLAERMRFIKEQRKKFRAGMIELKQLQKSRDLGHKRLAQTLREVEAKVRNLGRS